MQRVTTFLTFKSNGKDAVEFYCRVFKNSAIDDVMTMPGSDQLLHASFSLDGQQFMAMDGGDYFGFAEGTSLFVMCDSQDEVDYYWQALTTDGGEPGQCGWLKDRYGVSWQVIPKQLGELMSDPDQAKSGRVMQAMLRMNKIDIAALEAASAGGE